MDERKKNTSIQTPEAEENPLAKLDLRVLYVDMKHRLWFLVIIFLVLSISALTVIRKLSRTSLKRWFASAQLYHQTMSEKVPSFYKQVNTRIILEIASGGAVFQKASEKVGITSKQAMDLRKYLVIEIPKNQPNIINISTNFNSGTVASEFVNAMVEATLEEYVDLQNSNLKKIVADRQARKVVLQGKLQTFEDSLINFASNDTYLMPDKDLEQLSQSIVDAMKEAAFASGEIERLTKKVNDMEIYLDSTPDTLVETEKQVKRKEYSFTDMQNELDFVRRRYTEQHPFRQRKEAEFTIRKQRIEEEINAFVPANEIFTKLNATKQSMKLLHIQDKLELESFKVLLEHKLKFIEVLRNRVKQRRDVLSSYNETMRSINNLRTNINVLDEAINDNEALMNSAVPDLSILNYSSKASYSSESKKLMLVVPLAAGGAGAGGVAALCVLWGLLMGKIKSPKDFEIDENYTFLGMLPQRGVTVKKEVEAAIHHAFHKIHNMLEQRKRLFVIELSNNAALDIIVSRWTESFGSVGKSVFVLRCYPLDGRENVTKPTNYKPHAIDNDLVSVEKYGNQGFFFTENRYVLNQAEISLLNADLEQLENVYDVIVIERGNQVGSGDAVVGQLCQLAGTALVISKFGTDSKSQLKAIQADENTEFCNFGCIMTGIPKDYWKLLK